MGESGQDLLNVLEFLDESRIEIGAQALGNAEGAFLRALNHADKNLLHKDLLSVSYLSYSIKPLYSLSVPRKIHERRNGMLAFVFHKPVLLLDFSSFQGSESEKIRKKLWGAKKTSKWA